MRFFWAGGAAGDVVAALAGYQNADGGFGRGLEVDISAPVSNPFAARLAMQVMRDLPAETCASMSAELQTWLVANQHEDGDWHFAPEVREAPLAPWFAGWEFPSLNPACCVAGMAHLTEISTPGMLERVFKLFREKASPEQAASGDFYRMLPYVEYVAIVGVPEQETYIGALAKGIRKANDVGSYADAQHFFDHAINAGSPLVEQLPAGLLSSWADVLIDEVLEDGGWPSPYDPAWRPWATASALVTLARLRKGV